MKRAYFGTDGIRGHYGGAVVNEGFAARLGEAAGRYLLRHGIGGEVLIGRDTRASGVPLSEALGSGLAVAGAKPVSLGVLPTPAVSRAVRTESAAMGIVVTASHNPASDNGIKLFRGDGAKFSDAQELEIESMIRSEAPAPAGAPLAQRGAVDAYVAAAQELLPRGGLRRWRIVLDTANGATHVTSPLVLASLGAEVVRLGDSPDGHNINAGCGSEHPELLSQRVASSGARLGIAHDGDGDRCVLCDETGGVLDGDEVLAILATHALAKGTLAGGNLVVTVHSNLGVDAAVRAAGGAVVRTDVGDRYVAETMRRIGASLGGESSGHVICADFGPTGDGLAAALRVVAVMVETGRPLSELRRVMRHFPHLSQALPVREKRPVESLPELGAAMRRAEGELGSTGRILVRYSGTEPKLRLLVEGPDAALVSRAMEALLAAARRDLGP